MNYIINKKPTIVILIVGLIKRHEVISQYFPEPKFSGKRVKVKLDLSNYATKEDLKNAAGVDTLEFAKKVDLAILRSYVNKLDINKLKNY